MSAITIALDAMGGDLGAAAVVPAAVHAIKKDSDLKLILVGQEDVIRRYLAQENAKESERLQIHHASEVVGMGESPVLALRNKKDSSLRVAINLVKDGVAQACVSSGNTGALMATAKFVLKTIPGIDRPAIIHSFPTQIANQSVRLLDLGANVNCTSEHLFQFAVMASILTQAQENISHPTVGLLNIGEEEIKGNDLVKATDRLMAQHKNVINYIGYVEGDDIFKGVADVIVCDGFVGNVALKATEGAAKLIGQYISEAFRANFFTKLCGLFALPVLRSIKKRIDPGRYNGATFLGLRKTVIKSHGSADKKAFAHAIEEAVIEVRKDVPRLIHERVEKIFQGS